MKTKRAWEANAAWVSWMKKKIKLYFLLNEAGAVGVALLFCGLRAASSPHCSAKEETSRNKPNHPPFYLIPSSRVHKVEYCLNTLSQQQHFFSFGLGPEWKRSLLGGVCWLPSFFSLSWLSLLLSLKKWKKRRAAQREREEEEQTNPRALSASYFPFHLLFIEFHSHENSNENQTPLHNNQ